MSMGIPDPMAMYKWVNEMNSGCGKIEDFPGISVSPVSPSGFGLANVTGNGGSDVDFQGAGCNQLQPLPQFPALVPAQTGQIDGLLPDPIRDVIDTITEAVPYSDPTLVYHLIPGYGFFQGYGDATSHYMHFLYGDGTPKNDLPVGRMLSEIRSFRQDARDFFNQNLVPRIFVMPSTGC